MAVQLLILKKKTLFPLLLLNILRMCTVYRHAVSVMMETHARCSLVHVSPTAAGSVVLVWWVGFCVAYIFASSGHFG